MFTQAYAIAARFTLPVVISNRTDKGKCSSAIGACVVVNGDGWILTSAHLIKEIERQRQSMLRHHVHGKDVRKFEQDTTADKFFRKSKVRSFHPPAKGSIKNHSVWWGRDGAELRDVTLMEACDLALGRLHPFDGLRAMPTGDAEGDAPGDAPGKDKDDNKKNERVNNKTASNADMLYPAFKNPTRNYRPGRSLCKLGFPFHAIEPTFDEEKNAFVLPKGAVPLPLFPIEGMFTRVVMAPMPGVHRDKNAKPENGKFIETSSPGLIGQSGGPIVDTAGVVWALQSHTRHYPLGFNPPVPGQSESKAHKVPQFLHVGMGVHTEAILQLLKSRGVQHRVAD